VAARASRSAGIETGIALLSTDVDRDHEALRQQGVDVDDAFREEDELRWCSGAPLAGRRPQFRVRDSDGNALLIVAVT
jgi:hypothetical protein